MIKVLGILFGYILVLNPLLPSLGAENPIAVILIKNSTTINREKKLVEIPFFELAEN